MVFLNNIFSSYYFMLLKLRKINKIRIEDFQAMCLVMSIPFFITGALIKLLQKLYTINFPQVPKPLTFILVIFLIFIGYKYFLSNRERKNRIIDRYRNSTKQQQNIWKIISLLIIIIPLFVIIF